MAYEIGLLPLETLLPAIARAEDQLARLDEAVRRSTVGDGFVERAHFFDSAASMWVLGELVHVEDLVLHDAHMDVRAPSHELTISHTILRARRRIASTKAGWALSERGFDTLTGTQNQEAVTPQHSVEVRAEEGEVVDEPEPFAEEFAHIDAVLERSERLIRSVTKGDGHRTEKGCGLAVGDLMIRDPDWDEADRVSQWRSVEMAVQVMPPAIAAALLFDAWETIEPVQRQHWLGGLLVGEYLRSRGKVSSHLPSFNVGLKAVSRERRRAKDRTTRLIAFLDAMTATADAGMRELVRLQQARTQMERRLAGRRASSSLPSAIELVLSRPMISAAILAKVVKVTPRGALNLIAELGVRELTGRGRYRAWGVL
ncbi:RHE_PE00001 family protein [Manganibacter manganicus]|uniref:Uncharacterized protein n=1 Tax=Manganibacter manganicus TaxID=1873176 RepID=A0A1V8RJG6_9HYPH|nr:RHE_PE00001 family protein [Pseudaminobacter manganicus]OQM73351.1 hypothetical protein BFN67_08570 [Pseudaminobacter manganicus]